MARYQNNLLITRTDSGKRFYSTVVPSDPKFNEVPAQYIAKAGDRWDLLAYKIYGSPTYWYLLASANDAVNGSIFVKPGTILKIPEL
jgi:nucleoid-associated protein YgaU